MNKRSLSFLVFLAATALANPVHALYIGDGSGNLWNLDTDTNTSTKVGNSAMGAMYDIALDPISGNLYGVTKLGKQLALIDQTTGAATKVGGWTGAFINGLTFNSAGTLYGTGNNWLYTIDLVTGAATAVGATGFNSSGDIAFDFSGNLFLSATGGSGGDRLVSLDTTTGVGTQIGSIGYYGVYGLSFSDSTLLGFTSNGRTLTIDTSTGLGTQVTTNGIAAYGADGVGGVAQVPEPSVLALLGVGLVSVGFGRKRRRNL